MPMSNQECGPRFLMPGETSSETAGQTTPLTSTGLAIATTTELVKRDLTPVPTPDTQRRLANNRRVDQHPAPSLPTLRTRYLARERVGSWRGIQPSEPGTTKTLNQQGVAFIGAQRAGATNKI